uniref:FZ domain-containing protein n=1 Tax=Amphimedon queenslandica TaxID=400682 RepID=A0A1X7V346_AMPQE
MGSLHQFCTCFLLLSAVLIYSVRCDPLTGLYDIHHGDENLKRDARQGDCTFPTPVSPECNGTTILSRIREILYSNTTLTEAELDAIDTRLSTFCVPECIDPLVSYYSSCSFFSDTRDYIIPNLRQGTCGKVGNDYCQVRYLRRYAGDYNYTQRLIANCPTSSYSESTTDGEIDCTTVNDTCSQMLAHYNANMECCASPSPIGIIATRCGLTTTEPCASILDSGSNAIFLGFFPIMLAVLGVLVF